MTLPRILPPRLILQFTGPNLRPWFLRYPGPGKRTDGCRDRKERGRMHSATGRKDRKARVGAAVFPLSEGVRPSESLSKGLSFLHSLTRSSREHLRSGKDRKTAGFMVTPGIAAGTGQGWVGLGKGWAPGAGSSGRSSRQQDLVLWTRSSSSEHPGQLPERPRTPSLPGPAHLGAYWEM